MWNPNHHLIPFWLISALKGVTFYPVLIEIVVISLQYLVPWSGLLHFHCFSVFIGNFCALIPLFCDLWAQETLREAIMTASVRMADMIDDYRLFLIH